jgi:hypothetical protein
VICSQTSVLSMLLCIHDSSGVSYIGDVTLIAYIHEGTSARSTLNQILALLRFMKKFGFRILKPLHYRLFYFVRKINIADDEFMKIVSKEI